MKKVLFLFVIIAIGFLACKKENETIELDSGVIIGYDYRECACCGGYFIKINDDTLRFYEMPDDSDFTIEDETMPIDVELEWSNSDTQCMGDEIEVTSIYKQ